MAGSIIELVAFGIFGLLIVTFVFAPKIERLFKWLTRPRK
jgi:hypothetical protein